MLLLFACAKGSNYVKLHEHWSVQVETLFAVKYHWTLVYTRTQDHGSWIVENSVRGLWKQSKTTLNDNRSPLFGQTFCVLLGKSPSRLQKSVTVVILPDWCNGLKPDETWKKKTSANTTPTRFRDRHLHKGKENPRGIRQTSMDTPRSCLWN